MQVTQNAYFSLFTHPKQLLLATFCDLTAGIEKKDRTGQDRKPMTDATVRTDRYEDWNSYVDTYAAFKTTFVDVSLPPVFESCVHVSGFYVFTRVITDHGSAWLRIWLLLHTIKRFKYQLCKWQFLQNGGQYLVINPLKWGCINTVQICICIPL